MATSSIYDTFVIDTKEAADRLTKAFKDAENTPSARPSAITDEELHKNAEVAFKWLLHQSKNS